MPSIREMKKLLQSGAILPSALVADRLKLAKNLENLNNFIKITTDVAQEQAKKSDSRYQQGRICGPIDGIPVSVKDNICTCDIETTCASRMLENFKPSYNATVVQKLQDAGAVLIGKTNMDEFAMGSGCVNSAFGPVKNIWGSKYMKVKTDSDECETPKHNKNDFYVSGGSSGGCAVSVASGITFISVASDSGGSVRMPASYCGIVGLKPSYGRLSRYGLIPLVNSLDCPGILARKVDDARIAFNILAGFDPLDPTSSKDIFIPVRDEIIDIKKFKVGVPQEYHCDRLSREVVEVWGIVADLLETAGAKVVKVSLPHTYASVVCYTVLNNADVVSHMARYDGIRYGLRLEEDAETLEDMVTVTRNEGLNEVVRNRILSGNYFLLKRNYNKYFEQAMKVRRLIARDYLRVWESGVDALITPITLTEAPTYSWYMSKESWEHSVAQDFCCPSVNLAGLPAISIPIKLSRKGLPLSLQIITPIYREDVLLAIARWIENVVDFPKLEVQINDDNDDDEECKEEI